MNKALNLSPLDSEIAALCRRRRGQSPRSTEAGRIDLGLNPRTETRMFAVEATQPLVFLLQQPKWTDTPAIQLCFRKTDHLGSFIEMSTLGPRPRPWGQTQGPGMDIDQTAQMALPVPGTPRRPLLVCPHSVPCTRPENWLRELMHFTREVRRQAWRKRH